MGAPMLLSFLSSVCLSQSSPPVVEAWIIERGGVG